MHIPEARYDVLARGIHHRRISRRMKRSAPAHRRDPSAGDQESDIRLGRRASAVNDCSVGQCDALPLRSRDAIGAGQNE